MRPQEITKPLFAALAATVLVAGTTDAQEHRGFYFEMPLTVELAVERGLPVSGTDFPVPTVREIDDLVLIFRPAAPSFRIVRRRVDFAVKYEPDVEVFFENREISAVNHAAAAVFAVRVTPRLTVSAGDAFLRTNDPSRALGSTTILMGRGLFMQNTLYGAIDFRLTPLTSVGARFDLTTSSLDFGPEAIFPEQVNRYWSANLTRRLTRRDDVSVVYTLTDASGGPFALDPLPDPDARTRAAATGFRVRAHTVTLGYRRDLSQTVQLEASGGLIRDELTTHYAASARLSARLGKLFLAGGYDRGLSHAASERFLETDLATFRTDLAPASLLQSWVARLDGYVSRTVRIDLQFWATRRTPAEVAVVEPEILGGESLFSRVRTEWWAGERVALFAGFDLFRQDETILAGVPVDRRRFVTGLRFGLTPRMVQQGQREGAANR
jgi:hypothetical protein